MDKGIERRDWNNGQSTSFTTLGQFRVLLGKELIWNFPKDFINADQESWPNGRPYSYSSSDINRVIQEYIETPKEPALGKDFENDLFGITEILKAADRRFSTKRIAEHFSGTNLESVEKIVNARTATRRNNV